MIARTTLAKWPDRVVRLTVDLCPRRRQYPHGDIGRAFGGEVLMFHSRFFRAPSLCVAITSLIFRKDPSKPVECQGNEQDGEQRFHLCVNVPHPLLIRMHKWLSRAKFSRGKPLPFHKSELKKHRC
jgi:hypothetical protein